MIHRIEDGLDVLRREARGARGRDRSWMHHNSIMRRAQQHIEACGGCWPEWESRLKREFAELMRL